MTSQSTFRFDGASDDDARAAAQQPAQDSAQPEHADHDHAQAPHEGSPLSQEALDAVTQQVRDIAEVPAIEVSPQVLAEAFTLTRRLVSYHVPARLKALDLYVAPVGDALR